MAPRRIAAGRSMIPAAMLMPVAMKATPVKYAQNNGPGIHAGMRLAMKRGIRRWLTPKTTEETAKI
jgi:hypothetical protein